MIVGFTVCSSFFLGGPPEEQFYHTFDLPQTLPCYSNHLWKLALYYTTNVGKTISYTTDLGMVYTIYLW